MIKMIKMGQISVNELTSLPCEGMSVSKFTISELEVWEIEEEIVPPFSNDQHNKQIQIHNDKIKKLMEDNQKLEKDNNLSQKQCSVLQEKIKKLEVELQ